MKQLTLVFVAVFGLLTHTNAQEEKIKWMTFDEAIAANEKESKKFFIDFYTSWCGWCKKLDQVTFKDPEVIALMNKHYYAIKFDAERKDTIEFQKKDYVFFKSPESRRGYHTLAAALMKNSMSYPTMLIMEVEKETENVTFHNPLKGYMDGAAIEPILQYIGENLHQQKIDWNEYKSNYGNNAGN